MGWRGRCWWAPCCEGGEEILAVVEMGSWELVVTEEEAGMAGGEKEAEVG